MTYVTFLHRKPIDGLGYIPISQTHPHRFILKGWGVELGVLG